MTDTQADLETLVERCQRREGVLDAWLAKSFTDLLVVVEVPDDASVPEEVLDDLSAHGLVGYNEVHEVSATDAASAGDLPDRERYRFVDLDSRGTQQSYVVD
jgi:hypothetical protein